MRHINSYKNKLKTLIRFNFHHFPNTHRKASYGAYLVKGKTKAGGLKQTVFPKLRKLECDIKFIT